MQSSRIVVVKLLTWALKKSTREKVEILKVAEMRMFRVELWSDDTEKQNKK